MAKKPLVLVDLDGTLADFDGAMKRELAKLRAPGEPETHDDTAYEDVPHIKARRDLIKRKPGFWRSLEPIPLGFAILDVVREFDVKEHVLSRGPKSVPSAWAEKIDWCQYYRPGTPVTLANDKSLVYGRILIDDWPNYYLPWLKVRPRGLVIVPPQPWNANETHERAHRVDPTDPLWKAKLRARVMDVLGLIKPSVPAATVAAMPRMERINCPSCEAVNYILRDGAHAGPIGCDACGAKLSS